MSNSLCQIPTPRCQKYFPRVSLMQKVSLYCFLQTSPSFVAKRRKERSTETDISISKVVEGPLSLVLTTKHYEDNKHHKNALKHAWDQGKPVLKYSSV